MSRNPCYTSEEIEVIDGKPVMCKKMEFVCLLDAAGICCRALTTVFIINIIFFVRLSRS